MLRTNLSTRPFYNARAVRAGLLGMAVLAGGLTLFNTVEIVRLTASQSTLGSSEAEARREATRLRGEATRIRSQINQAELETVAAAAREANALIDKRAFSWTDLMAQFETTLPEDVRVRSVQPRLADGAFIVTVTVEARSAEDIDDFIEALEQTGNFRDVLPRVQLTTPDDLIESTIEGVYAAGSPRPEAAAR
jgi:Tfp pilus assembly protein PilN